MIILKGEQPINLFDEFLLFKRRLVTTQFFFIDNIGRSYIKVQYFDGMWI